AYSSCASRISSRGPPTCPLFPYTTLFRSAGTGAGGARGLPQACGDLRRIGPRQDRADPPHRRGVRAARRVGDRARPEQRPGPPRDRKSTRLNSSHVKISYAVFCLKKKKKI